MVMSEAEHDAKRSDVPFGKHASLTGASGQDDRSSCWKSACETLIIAHFSVPTNLFPMHDTVRNSAIGWRDDAASSGAASVGFLQFMSITTQRNRRDSAFDRQLTDRLPSGWLDKSDCTRPRSDEQVPTLQHLQMRKSGRREKVVHA